MTKTAKYKKIYQSKLFF